MCVIWLDTTTPSWWMEKVMVYYYFIVQRQSPNTVVQAGPGSLVRSSCQLLLDGAGFEHLNVALRSIRVTILELALLNSQNRGLYKKYVKDFLVLKMLLRVSGILIHSRTCRQQRDMKYTLELVDNRGT